MRSVLEFIMRGPVRAALVSAALAVVATVVAPFSYFSGAVVGLATLRNGAIQGALVLVGAGVVYGVLSALLIHSLVLTWLMLLVIWAPTYVLCMALRSTSSQGLTLTFGAVLAVIGVSVFHLWVGDTAAWWRDVFDEAVVNGIKGLKVEAEPQVVAQLMQLLDVMAPLMAGLVAAALLFGAFFITLIARWFHAVLDNPGGFGKEFRSLRLDRRVAWAVIGLGALAVFANDLTGGFGREILCVAIILYLFQGVALVHGVVAQLGASIGWLFLLYILLIVAREPVLLLLSLTGFADTWLNIRQRIGSKPANS